jgi:hypothetical protein
MRTTRGIPQNSDICKTPKKRAITFSAEKVAFLSKFADKQVVSMLNTTDDFKLVNSGKKIENLRQ